MKIIFAGTPDFSVPSLKRLVDVGYLVGGVYTKPDRPVGRGQKLSRSAVKVFAIEHHIPVYQPETLRTPEAQKTLADLQPDLMIVVAYGLILPQAVLDIPRWGCINVHASLLPRWRGASPIQRSIMAGDEQTGITIMQMDAGLDTGNILYKMNCLIEKEDTSQTLHDRLAELGGEALIQFLKKYPEGPFKGIPQSEDQVTYAQKITKEEGWVNWHLSAVEIERKIRAFNPWPIVYTYFKDQMIRIWRAEVLEQSTQGIEPGTLLKVDKKGIEVATGSQILHLMKLQLPGGKPLPVQDILNGHPLLFEKGTVFSKF